MAKTPDTVALQKGAVTYTQPEQTNTKKAVDLMSTLLSTPTAPTGTTLTPQVQQVASNELMGTSGLTGALAAAAPTTPTTPDITDQIQALDQSTSGEAIVTPPPEKLLALPKPLPDIGRELYPETPLQSSKEKTEVP